jgi:tetratricopeptide (TPR) repeat protein
VTADRSFLDRVERLFQEAMEVDPRERNAFVERAAAGEECLRTHVQSLLSALEDADAKSLWETNAHQHLHTEALDPDLDRYRLLERIGAGGMGAVYKAFRADDEFSKLVAVKVVLIPNPSLIGRFRRERQLLAGLEHPNIARLLDGGTCKSGAPFLVMEYVDGIPINQYVESRRLAVAEILELLRKVCAAVSYAHRNLIVHRDLKPSNILVGGDGEPRLLDFGIAKAMDGTAERTMTGFGAMTLEYASPEQVRGASITTATDVYSLGVLLYELLTGAIPYRKTGNPLDLAEAITNGQPAPLAKDGRRFDAELENIVAMAMRKEPERRYTSVDQFSEDLRRYLAGQPITAHRDTPAYRARKFVRRHAVAVVASAVVFMALVAGIAGTLWQARAASAQRARAERRFNDVRRIADSLLFEFNASLEGIPGTLTARQLIVKRGMEYLDSLAVEAGNDRALESKLADAYEKVGTITFDVNERLAISRKELAIRENLSREEPLNRGYQQRLSASYVSVGDATNDSGNLRGALDNYLGALAISEALSMRYPLHPELILDTANCLELVGQVLERMDRTDEASQNEWKALTLVQQAIASGMKHRDYPQFLMVVRLSLAQGLSRRGDFAGALAQAREALRLAEEMSAADPNNATNRRNTWVCNVRLGDIVVKSGDPASAAAYYRKALPVIRGLAEVDTGDKGHRRGSRSRIWPWRIRWLRSEIRPH